VAFEWNRPEEGDGIVLAFRRHQAPQSSVTVVVRGLKPDGDYEVSFEDYGIALIKSGRELANGLAIKIPEAPGSLLIKYRRAR
jgi:alpha-galactosidase